MQQHLLARPSCGTQSWSSTDKLWLQAVIAHELGHLKCDHGVWLTIANVLASGTLSVLPAASRAVEEALLRWLRAAELTCDRAALLVVQVGLHIRSGTRPALWKLPPSHRPWALSAGLLDLCKAALRAWRHAASCGTVLQCAQAVYAFPCSCLQAQSLEVKAHLHCMRG